MKLSCQWLRTFSRRSTLLSKAQKEINVRLWHEGRCQNKKNKIFYQPSIFFCLICFDAFVNFQKKSFLWPLGGSISSRKLRTHYLHVLQSHHSIHIHPESSIWYISPNICQRFLLFWSTLNPESIFLALQLQIAPQSSQTCG